MFRILRAFFGLAFLILAIVFSVFSIKEMQPKYKGYPTQAPPYQDHMPYRYDTHDGNKGLYVIAYAILACGCYIGAAVLLNSVKDKNS